MTKKGPSGQHYVPKCYLREFIDPKTPSEQEPYVWIFKRNDRYGKRKSPSNILKETDLYTLRLDTGEKDYFIEETLAMLEGRYSEIFRKKIKKCLPLNEEEHLTVCIFIAAMLQRTLRSKRNLEEFMDQLIEMTSSMEKQHGVDPKKSNELRAIKIDAHKLGVIDGLAKIGTILFEMNMAFLCVPSGKKKFIASDDPCNLFNPDLQGQAWYGPGLGQKNIQLTMPLSPGITICFSWSSVRGYMKITNSMVEDLNRMTRALCPDYFIANSPKTRLIWFSKYPLDPIFFHRLLNKRFLPKVRDFVYKYVGKRKV
ncbi:MAG: DUF4238 domain-containing protein [Atribacterota bacterium]|nr:DUF4238 domain-containing protein [Atribacterota bacterium]